MAEYIEKEALLLRIDLHGTNKFGMLDEDIRGFIKEQPAADVVQVVRCKECEYYNREAMSPGTGWCECLERGEFDNHFCSYGERKEGVEDG